MCDLVKDPESAALPCADGEDGHSASCDVSIDCAVLPGPEHGCQRVCYDRGVAPARRKRARRVALGENVERCSPCVERWVLCGLVASPRGAAPAARPAL